MRTLKEWYYSDDSDKHPYLSELYLYGSRFERKVDTFFAPKYKLQKEHKQIGLTKSDRPLKRYDEFEASCVLAWVNYPILVRFRRNQYAISYPENLKSIEEWHKVLDKIIYAFQEIIYDEYTVEQAEEHYKAIDEGLSLYAKWFLNLWD